MKFEKAAEKLYSDLIEKEVDGKLQYFKPRRVWPPVAKDGSINWWNFIIGNWKSLLLVALIVTITIGFIYEYGTNLAFCAEYLGDMNNLTSQTLSRSFVNTSLQGVNLT